MNIEEIKRSLQNPAITPAYRQTLEKRLKELEVGQAPETPKPAAPEKSKPYAGVSNMTVEEIVAYFSQGGFFRLDEPITGLQALQSLYSRFGILGQDRRTIERVATAILQMGGEVPDMEHVEVSDLLKRAE